MVIRDSATPTSTATIHRSPFQQVVQTWNHSSDNTTTTKVSLSKQRSSSNNLPPVITTEVTQLLEEERSRLQKIKSTNDKFIQVCKSQQDDSVTFELLHELLEAYSGVNLTKIIDKQQNSCSLLHLLAQKNKVRCLELLSQHFPNLDVRDSLASTPFLYTVAYNCEEASAYLITRKVNVNAKDVYNKFGLLLALRNQNYKIADLILNSGTLDVHIKGTKGNTILHTMAQEGNLFAIQYLVEQCNAAPQRRNYEEENVLWHALPFPDICMYLADKFNSRDGLFNKMALNQNVFGRNLFHRVAYDGHFDNLIQILKRLNFNGLTETQISTLLNQPDRQGDTPLILAVKNSRVDLVSFLCECIEVRINDGDKSKNTALFYAASIKNDEIMKIITSAGGAFKATASMNNDNDESDTTDSTGWIWNRFSSLRLLLPIIIASVAITCIIAILVISIGFFAGNIYKSGQKFRTSSFVSLMGDIGSNLNIHSSSFRATYNQITDPTQMTDFTKAFKLVYQAVRSAYTYDTILSSATVMLPGVKMMAVSKGNSLTNFQVATTFTNQSHLTVYAIPDILTTTWREVDIQHPVRLTPFFNPAEQANIVRASMMNRTYWTDIYTKPPLTDLYVSLVCPFRDVENNNSFVGYLALDASTTTIRQFIQQQAKKLSSTIVLIERKTGYLISTSDPSFLVINKNLTQRYDGTEDKGHLISSMVSYSRKMFGGRYLSKVKAEDDSNQFGKFKHNGKMYALDIAGITDTHGIDWVLVNSVPMLHFFAPLYTALGVMLAVSIVLIVLSAICAIVAAHTVMIPILQLIDQAQDIKMLQLEKVEKSLAQPSMLAEIRTLQTSFASMTARLKQFRSFIPSHILAVIDAEIHGTSESVVQTTGLVEDEKQDEKRKTPQNNSSHNNTGSHVSHSTISNFGKGMINRALNSKLTSATLTVMTIKLPDLSELFDLYSADEILEAMNDLVSSIRVIGQETNFQLVSMSTKKVVVVWNSFISQTDHCQRACKTAVSLQSKLKQMQQQWSTNGLPILGLNIGIATGLAYYGNVGRDTKFFTVIGNTAMMSDKLCNSNKTYGIQVIVSDEIYESEREEFHMRPIGEMEDMVLYELGDAKHPDSWQTELEYTSQSNWQDYIDGYTLFSNDQYADAVDKFKIHLNNHPDDSVCHRMVELCNDMLSSHITDTTTATTTTCF
jgi:ankyrin repeat protein/class 3 adenylate cyclase